MNLLLENPLPIWSLGAVCLAVSVIVFFAKRSLGSFLGMAGVIAVTLLSVFVERNIITPSEEVEQALATLMSAIEANNLSSVLAQLAPTAQHVRADAETLMPQLKIRETGSTAVRVEVDESVHPPRATVHFRGRIEGTHAHSGSRIFYFDQVEIDWQESGDQWLVVDYRAKFRGKPVKAADGFRAIR